MASLAMSSLFVSPSTSSSTSTSLSSLRIANGFCDFLDAAEEDEEDDDFSCTVLWLDEADEDEEDDAFVSTFFLFRL
jgi:hypothetical protein